MYPETTAVSVKGMLIFMKSQLLGSKPFLRRMPSAVMLAEAPMGVRLPPSVAPHRRPTLFYITHYKDGFIDIIILFGADLYTG